MSHAAEPPRHSCDLLAVCNIADPLLHRTCIGVNKSGTSCKNVVSKVSRESASHWLEILAMIGTSEYSLSSYSSIGRARQESGVHGLTDLADGRNDSNVASALLPVIQGYSPPTSRLPSVRRCSQAVTPTMVRENQIPFHVSSARLAVVSVPRGDGRVRAVTLRTFRKGRQPSDVECDICRECRSDDTVYLNCEECSGEFHWSCMEAWLYHGTLQAEFTCPHCREDRLFDGFYYAPCTRPAHAAESPLDTTMPHQNSGAAGADREASSPSRRRSNRQQETESVRSGGSSRSVRRSGRVTRRPDYFIPS
ncbi:hypothetical protein CNMCM8980_005370 [Aspergillus fumigatiaffinis]|nr:hypothetical protein CNMCM8980_005370 [Aspergillus fumigatiaffinis]